MRILRFLGIFAAGILSAAIVQTALADNPTPTPTAVVTPAPNLHFRKIASGPVEIGGTVRYVIDVTNDGTADSGSQTVQDVLPAGIPWAIESDSWGCAITFRPDIGRQVLDCAPIIVPKADKNGVPGYAEVTVRGQSVTCGSVVNIANFNGSPFGVPAVATVNCPATPTPSPTKTPEPTPTAFPASPTPITIRAAPTATPTVASITVIPKAPNTGNTPPEARSHDGLWFLAIFILPGLFLAAYGLLMRRRRW